MSLNWESFKSYFNNFDNIVVTYIDEEGDEITVESQFEFEEVLRNMKREGKNYAELLVKTFSSKAEVVYVNENVIKTSSDTKMCNEKEPDLPVSCKNGREKSCQSNDEVPPVWFSNYMKEFQKELCHQIKCNIQEAVNNAFESQKKNKNKQQRMMSKEPFLQVLPCSSNEKKMKKKKASNEESSDLAKVEQRAARLFVKYEKLIPSKFERPELKFEKLDNRSRLLLEEARKSLEKKRHHKSKSEKKSADKQDKVLKKPRRQVEFLTDGLPMKLRPGQEFFTTLYIVNTGDLLSNAVLICLCTDVFFFEKEYIHLPPLAQGEQLCVKLKGRVTDVVGLFYFKCTVMEGSGKFLKNFMYMVEISNPPKSRDIISPPASQSFASIILDQSPDQSNADKELSQCCQPKEEDANDDALINFYEKDIIKSSQKKIEGNIMEIQNKLSQIDLLQSSFSSSSTKDHNRVDSCKVAKASQTLQGGDGGDTQNDTSVKRVESSDFVVLKSGSSVGELTQCEKTGNEETDKTEVEEVLNKSPDVENGDYLEAYEFEKLSRDGGNESDSELSIIFTSEEEENFIVIPEGPENSDSGCPTITKENDVEICEGIFKSMKAEESKCTSSEPKVESSEDLKNDEDDNDKKEDITQDNLASHSRNRRSSFGEERSESKTKKLKSGRSTEYRFTAANLSQPTFTPLPNKQESDSVPIFTFPRKLGKNSPQKVKRRNIPKREDLKEEHVPLTNSSEKVVFAVSRNGYCLPVKVLVGKEKQGAIPKVSSTGFKEMKGRAKENKVPNSGRGEKAVQDDIKKANDQLNDVANTFLNGASNMASMAINTAKSVINNIQSAYSVVTEKKTEVGKPAFEPKADKASMEALLKLFEMGFVDLELNRELLNSYDNELFKVVEELIQIYNKNPSNSPRNN